MSEKLILTLPVIPAKRDEFVALINSVLHDTRAYKGFVDIQIWLPETDDGAVWLYEEWQTRDDQASYFNWRVETGLLEAMAPFLAGEPQIVWMKEA